MHVRIFKRRYWQLPSEATLTAASWLRPSLRFDNRKARKPRGDLLGAMPGDVIARVTAIKTAEAILRAGFAGC